MAAPPCDTMWHHLHFCQNQGKTRQTHPPTLRPLAIVSTSHYAMAWPPFRSRAAILLTSISEQPDFPQVCAAGAVFSIVAWEETLNNTADQEKLHPLPPSHSPRPGPAAQSSSTGSQAARIPILEA